MALKGTAFSLYRNWVKSVSSLTQGVQFLYKKLENSEYRMAIVISGIDRKKSYDLIKIKHLEENSNEITYLDLRTIAYFVVVPKGSSKETAIILYGR